MKKRIISIFLCLMLLMTIAPLGAFATGTSVPAVENVVWNGDDGLTCTAVSGAVYFTLELWSGTRCWSQVTFLPGSSGYATNGNKVIFTSDTMKSIHRSMTADGSCYMVVSAENSSHTTIASTKTESHYLKAYPAMSQPQNAKWSGAYAVWDAVSGVSSYTIWLYEVDSSGTINPSHIYTNTVTTTRVSLASKLEADKTYRFFVQSNASDSTHRNSASVKSNDVTTIGKIEAIGLTAPEIGRLASENAKSIKAPAGVNYTLSSAGWLDKSNNGAVLSSSAKFEADHEYTLRVYATPKTGYIFVSTSNITGTVDGKAGTVGGVYNSDAQYALRYDYGKPGKLTISSVDVSGYAVPVAGAKAGDCMNLTVSENCRLDMSKCYWYCRSTGKTLAADDVFEAGKQYALTIYVCADANCRFAANTAVTINGSTEYVDTEHIGLGDIAIPFWTKPVTVAAAIKSVNVYGYVPAVVGEKAGDHMNCNTIGSCSIDWSSSYWYCDTDRTSLSADDVFEAGKEYSLFVFVVPNGTNFFADDVEYTVNGGTEYVDYGNSQSSDDCVDMWTVSAKAKTGIQAVAITGYEPPVVGDKAGDHMKLSVGGSCSIDWSSSYWYCDTTYEALAASDVFEAGKEYSLYLYLTSAANYLFAENAAVTVNGSKQYVDSVSTYSYRTELDVWTLPVEAIGHNYTAVVTAPTCTEKGYTTYTCTVCGDSYKSNYVNALGHQTTVKNAKPATCAADGYTGDKVCTVCGAVVEQGKIIAKLGHSYGAWKVTKAPTCTEKGIETRYCSRCDATETREVEAAGHAYKDGVCTVCGEKDPNYVVAPDAPTLSIAKADGKIKLSWNAVDGANKYWIYRSTDGTNYKYYDTTYGTSYTNSSVTSGTKYYYMVKAVSTFSGKDYISGYSNAKSTIPLTTPVVKASLSTGKISLSWGSVTGATKYWIYRSTDGVNFKYYDSTTKTSYTNSSVTAGTTYYYEVRAVKTVNGTDWTSDYSAAASVLVLNAPNVSISKADGKISLSWTAVDGAVKYWVYRSTDGTNFKYYDTTTKTSYTNSSVTSGTKYYYKVKAVNADDGSSALSAAKSTIPLSTPTVSAALSNGKVNLSWNSVTGATKYWIYRSTDGVNFKYYDSTTKTTYTNSSVTAGTTYYYEVRAVKTVNGTDWTGSYSTPVSITR